MEGVHAKVWGGRLAEARIDLNRITLSSRFPPDLVESWCFVLVSAFRKDERFNFPVWCHYRRIIGPPGRAAVDCMHPAACKELLHDWLRKTDFQRWGKSGEDFISVSRFNAKLPNLHFPQTIRKLKRSNPSKSPLLWILWCRSPNPQTPKCLQKWAYYRKASLYQSQ